MYNETITYYSKHPFNKFEMDNPTVTFYEENEICWDYLTIYLKIKDDVIENWSFIGDTAIITTACWWIFWESIIWEKLGLVLKMDYNTIVELVWEWISERRQKAAVLALLTTRNTIHKYLNDWIVDDFDAVIPN